MAHILKATHRVTRSVNKIVDNIFFHVLTQQDDTSGDYKRTLLKLCGGDDE